MDGVGELVGNLDTLRELALAQPGFGAHVVDELIRKKIGDGAVPPNRSCATIFMPCPFWNLHGL